MATPKQCALQFKLVRQDSTFPSFFLVRTGSSRKAELDILMTGPIVPPKGLGLGFCITTERALPGPGERTSFSPEARHDRSGPGTRPPAPGRPSPLHARPQRSREVAVDAREARGRGPRRAGLPTTPPATVRRGRGRPRWPRARDPTSPARASRRPRPGADEDRGAQGRGARGLGPFPTARAPSPGQAAPPRQRPERPRPAPPRASRPETPGRGRRRPGCHAARPALSPGPRDPGCPRLPTAHAGRSGEGCPPPSRAEPGPPRAPAPRAPAGGDRGT